jgi:hypothetical protein
MFHITPAVSRGPASKNTPVRQQSSPSKPTPEPKFGLTTVSGEQQFGKTRPITPAPTAYKTLGSRLDYYA